MLSTENPISIGPWGVIILSIIPSFCSGILIPPKIQKAATRATLIIPISFMVNAILAFVKSNYLLTIKLFPHLHE